MIATHELYLRCNLLPPASVGNISTLFGRALSQSCLVGAIIFGAFCRRIFDRACVKELSAPSIELSEGTLFDCIVDPAAISMVATVPNETRLAQYPQMMRNEILRHSQHIYQFAYAEFTLSQEGQNAEASRVGKNLQGTCQPFDLRLGEWQAPHSRSAKQVHHIYLPYIKVVTYISTKICPCQEGPTPKERAGRHLDVASGSRGLP